ncbi:NUDIX domain-containing protein [Protofrankia symbiont of Coriaria ruscifolia]|uniref:NUDIX domain-containing protein n=1 Tax=Protofrankia symbiont of Coriaria ruscifolia TaxID=1306542 RepID=UPI001F5F087E|nr:NUDIX domain-containing protein [Protofrankia symbiont of Coriaria ruscifolia]
MFEKDDATSPQTAHPFPRPDGGTSQPPDPTVDVHPTVIDPNNRDNPTRSIRSVLSARMLFTSGERVLVANRRGHSWFFLPGGNVEPGESVEGALRRKIREEAGLATHALDFVGCVEHSYVEAGQSWHELNVVFAATLPPFAQIGSREEAIDIGSVSVAALDTFEFRPAHLRTAILSWLRTHRPSWYGPDGLPPGGQTELKI